MCRRETLVNERERSCEKKMQSYTMRTINALNGTMATNNKVIKTESDHGDGSVSVPDATGASGKQACGSYWC